MRKRDIAWIEYIPFKQSKWEGKEKEIDQDEFLEELKPDTWYNMTVDEKDIFDKIMKRFEAMKWQRKKIDVDWATWEKIAESKWYPYKDWRARSNVPLFRTLQELFVSESNTRRAEHKIEPVGLSDVDKVEILNEVFDYDWNRQNRDEAMNEAEYQCSLFGTCFYFTGYEENYRIINDLEEVDWKKQKYKKQIMKEWTIVLKTLDIRNVYIDDRVNSFDDANDEIYLEYITQEQLESEIDSWVYNNLEYVGLYGKQDQVYYTWEDRAKNYNNVIEKMHYWNQQSDRYIVIYNRQIIGRDIPIPYSHKKLPIVPRQYWKVLNSIYWRGLAEACMQFLTKINTLEEMIFSSISRSNNSIFAIWNGLNFNESLFSFNNQLIKFNGQLNDGNFREIKGMPPNQAIFQYSQDLFRQIAIYIWIDPSSIIWQPSSTAFETAVRTESALKRVNVVLMNRDFALQKVFQRHVANLMQFFPLSEAERITEVSSDGDIKNMWKWGWYKKILLEDKQYNEGTNKLVEVPWKFDFEVRPEYIRGQVDVRIQTNYNSPTLKSLKQENMTNFLKWYSMYQQMAMQDPTMSKIMKPDDFVRQLAFTYDIDINSVWWFSDSLVKEKEKLMTMVRQMAGAEQDTWIMGNNPWQEQLPWQWPWQLPWQGPWQGQGQNEIMQSMQQNIFWARRWN